MKPTALFLLVLILVGGPVLADMPAVNVALHRPFAGSSAILPGWTGLVDGERESDSAPGCYATSNDPTFPKFVEIDLGSECSISKVIVYNSANGNTRTVALSCSTDGANFKKLRDPDFIFADQDAIVLSVAFQARPARFVRLTFRDTWKGGLGGDNCLFVREVEVYGQPGKAQNGDALKAAAAQPPLDRPRLVDVFRHYCLRKPGELSVAVLGDFTTIEAQEEGHWANFAASALRRAYPDKPLTVETVGGVSGSIATAQDWASQQREDLAPDLILVSYGAQAATARADVDEFRVKYQNLVNTLLDKTAALIVCVTPPPYLPGDAVTTVDRDRDPAPYAWAVEQVALGLGLPLVRTASVMARLPEPSSRSVLLLDPAHRGQVGHQALGLAIGELLR